MVSERKGEAVVSDVKYTGVVVVVVVVVVFVAATAVAHTSFFLFFSSFSHLYLCFFFSPCTCTHTGMFLK